MEIFNYSMSLFWCPAHVNIAENESVDALAKEATEGNLLRIHNFHRTLSNTQQLAKKNFKFDKKKKPIVRNNVKLVTYPSKIFESLNKLERSESSIIYQLRSGHSPLNNYLHRIKKLDSPDCTVCKTTEDVHHFLIKCSRFENERKTFRQTLRAKKINIDFNSIQQILDSPKTLPHLANFILSTHRFDNLQTYRDVDDN
jgi:hypothetical protein